MGNCFEYGFTANFENDLWGHVDASSLKDAAYMPRNDLLTGEYLATWHPSATAIFSDAKFWKVKTVLFSGP